MDTTFWSCIIKMGSRCMESNVSDARKMRPLNSTSETVITGSNIQIGAPLRLAPLSVTQCSAGTTNLFFPLGLLIIVMTFHFYDYDIYFIVVDVIDYSVVCRYMA